MALNWFSKKEKSREVVDFTPKDSDMPIPAKMKEKLLAGRLPVAGAVNLASSSSPQSSASQGSSGFFGGFFGGSASSDSSSSLAQTPQASQTSPATDFWGNPVNNSASSNQTAASDSQINDVLYRVSRLTDRIELLEKKLDRAERKIGISREE